MLMKTFERGKGMICPDCGTNNSTNEAVCTGCGRVLLEAAKGYGKDFAARVLQLLSEEDLLKHYISRSNRMGCTPVTRVTE